MNIAAIRAVLAGHQPYGVRRAVELLTNKVEQQEAIIANLRETLNGQQERHDNQISDLRRQIQQLKGVHGA